MDYDKIGYELGAAGIGLGAFSTLLDALSACSRLYKMWRSLRDLDGRLGLLRAKLVLQHALLEQWERDWMPFSSSSSSPSSSERQRGLTKSKQWWTEPHSFAVAETLKAVQQLLEGLEPLREACTRSSVHRNRTSAVVEKLSWAGDRADESQRSLEHLESLLAGLYRLLPPRTPNAKMSQVILAVEDLLPEQIGQDAHPFSTPPSSSTLGGDGGVDNLHQGASDAFSKTMGLRKLSRQLDHDLQDRMKRFICRPTTTRNLAIKSSRVQVTSNDHSTAGLRSYGTLDSNQPIMIEWKKYDKSWVGKKGIELTGRIYNIAHLLNSDTKPDELLTFKCLGYFDNVEKSCFGFVFALPGFSLIGSESDNDPTKRMVSLKSLLDQPSPETLPTLEDRYEATYSLALSLSVLHAVSWLHKSIRSHNILFALSVDGRPDWSRPFLVGFDFSRPDGVDEPSEKLEESARFNIYRHPLALGDPREGYKRSFDIYSLGVVLAEVALWRPAWKLYKEGMSAEKFQAVLIDKSKGWLGHLLGSAYQTAAVKCLDRSFDEKQHHILQSFYIEVVEVLGRMREQAMIK